MKKKVSKRGGYRPGAGAKKTGRNTTCISFSVHKDFAEPLKLMVQAKIKELKAAKEAKTFVPVRDAKGFIKKIIQLGSNGKKKTASNTDYLKKRLNKKLGLKE